MAIGKIFITRAGYDPELGGHVKDPYLGDIPSIGACRPNIRKQVVEGDHIFVISGKVPGANQFVMGGFEVANKLSATEAFDSYPDQRLRLRDDGQLTGNIIVDSNGVRNPLDNHTGLEGRIPNYVVGRNLIALREA